MINVAEILKDCPKGTKSPIYGEVEFMKINEKYPIVIYSKSLGKEALTKDGRYSCRCPDGECMLFPSKENRDWSTFKVHKKYKEFKPYDKVLIRFNNKNTWTPSLYGYLDKSNNGPSLPHWVSDNNILPYKDNKAVRVTNY